MEKLPLSSVRMFAVVARRSSISRAAEELNVTPSAVSHQIKSLEDYLGTRLFDRYRNTLKLTPAGRQYMAQVSEGLLLLARATETIKAAKGRQVLRIAAPASLAALWLIGRVGGFMKQHPEVAVSVTAASGSTVLLDDAFDVAFWYGGAAVPGLCVETLGTNRVFPVCKMGFVTGERPLRAPADLARCTMLDSDDDTYHRSPEVLQPGWRGWLQAAAVPEVIARRHLSFTPRILMHRAVTAGLGVGLSRTLLAADALASKDLVVPFGPAVLQQTTYQLVYPSYLAKRKDVAAFREWVLEEALASSSKVERALKPFIAK